MSIILIAARVWISSLFFYTASLKMADSRGTSRSIRRYNLLPARLTGAAGVALPLAEAAAGVLVLGGWFWPAGSALTLLLGVSFCYATWSALRRGINVDCGCAGANSGRLTLVTFSRALLVCGSAALLLSVTGVRTHVRPWWVLVVGAVFAVPAAREWWLRRAHARYRKAQEATMQAEVSRQYALLSSLQVP